MEAAAERVRVRCDIAAVDVAAGTAAARAAPSSAVCVQCKYNSLINAVQM